MALSILKVMLRAHERIAIIGGPRTGKTTLSHYVDDRPVVHADDLIKLGWSEASASLSKMVNDIRGPVVVEGVAVPRALRKGMRVDAVLWLSKVHHPQSSGQASMTKAVQTVFDEWAADHRDVPVYRA